MSAFALITSAHRVAGGGHPPPAPTERSVRISRTTLFGESFTAQLRCYSFEFRCHDSMFFSLHRRPPPPVEGISCFLRTSLSPLTASPCGRLSRPRSTISQSDFRQAIGSSSRERACRTLQGHLEPDGSLLFAMKSFSCMPAVRTPEAPRDTRHLRIPGSRLPP